MKIKHKHTENTTIYFPSVPLKAVPVITLVKTVPLSLGTNAPLLVDTTKIVATLEILGLLL